MAPAEDMRRDEDAVIQCFYPSNMVPQLGKGLNHGIWKELEEDVLTIAVNGGLITIKGQENR